MTTHESDIQRVSADDIPMMRALLAMLGKAFGEMDTYTGAQPDDQYLHRLLSSGQFIALAALARGEVVGGLAAYELQKFEQARSEIYIYDWRRRHCADADCQRPHHTLRTIARERGAWVIYVQADPPDAPAMALYSALGTREDVCHFDIAV